MKDQYNDQANSVDSMKQRLNSLLKLVISNPKNLTEDQQSWLIQLISEMVKAWFLSYDLNLSALLTALIYLIQTLFDIFNMLWPYDHEQRTFFEKVILVN